MTSVLVVANEPIGPRMTGPAIRCWELARVLGREFRVTLAAPETAQPPTGVEPLGYSRARPSPLEDAARQADAVLLSGFALQDFPGLARAARVLVADIYDPFPIENLELSQGLSIEERFERSRADFATVGGLLARGDFFICGSEPQRDFWLGMLGASGRLNPLSFAADPSFRKLLDVVPMGLPDEPPPDSSRLLDPQIGSDDFLLVWPGGVWDWLDPVTAVEAVGLLATSAPDVKLLFPGLRHPHPERIGRMRAAETTLRRADELGLLGTRVLYVDWTPYQERAAYLRAAGAAISLHFDHLEARLAIRSRLLDCLWAQTPLVATRGDILGEEMAARGLAKLVPPGEPAAVAEAVLGWRESRATRQELSGEFAALGSRYRWSAVARPLVEFLREPRCAPDRALRRPTALAAQARASGRSVPAISPRHPAHPGGLPPHPRSGVEGGSSPTDPGAGSGKGSSVEPGSRQRALELPFDQYQRHREVAIVVNALRRTADESLLLLDVGGGPDVTPLFLGPRDRVVSLDRQPAAHPWSVAGDARHLPFADGAFDLAVTLDTLEHLPSGERLRAIDECLRVSRRGVVIAAPFASSETGAAESLLFEFIRRVLGAEHEQLREHRTNGLPDRSELEASLQERGLPYLVRPSGYVHRWLAMMLLKHYVMSLPDSEALHRRIDAYYNRFYADADRREPAYRSLVFVAKEDPGILGAVAKALDQPTSTTPEGRSASSGSSPVSQAVDLLAGLANPGEVRSGDAADRTEDASERDCGSLGEWLDGSWLELVGLEAEIRELRETLEARGRELATANDLLERVARGRAMRILNALSTLLRPR